MLTIPKRLNDGGIRTTNFAGRPARNEPVCGVIQGADLVQYDYTPEQYAALQKLTAALCRVFPRMKCDYPRDADGKLIPRKLPDEELENYRGVLGHYRRPRIAATAGTRSGRVASAAMLGTPNCSHDCCNCCAVSSPDTIFGGRAAISCS